ncbi:MAG: ABC transporter ATP-binding protein [Hydrogenothermaceae bacterium]|nr:ABC transporter ATP-binding protein [Hydrogenothermaceae bacterium]
MSDKIVQAKNLRKVYKTTDGSDTVALKSVDMEIERGEMVAVMGPSGSGKSTLLHLLGGIDIPTEGEVLIEGKNIYKMEDKKLSKFRNENIGFIFQFHYLLSDFTALENVAIPLELRGDKEAYLKAEEMLRRLSLEHRLNHKPAMLSGGEQQRVAIARAVVCSPKILIADEPTGNLDSENAKKTMEIIKGLSEEFQMSIIIATHDVEIAQYCNYIYHLKDGMIAKIEKK